MDITEYYAALAKYPLKYKFKGINGNHTSLRAALLKECTLYDQLLELDRDGYVDHFEELPEEQRALYKDKYDYSSQMASDFFDYSDALSTYLEDADTQEELAKRYPLEAVYDAASQVEVPVNDVVAICDICDKQPIWWDGDDFESLHYCGMCGGSRSADKIDAARALAAEGPLFPFRKFRTVHDYVKACLDCKLYDLAELSTSDFVALTGLFKSGYTLAIRKDTESIYTQHDGDEVVIPFCASAAENVDIEQYHQWTVLSAQ